MPSSAYASQPQTSPSSLTSVMAIGTSTTFIFPANATPARG
ncbi:hypothetical protein HMPREF9622_02422 [Cutibacterium modestum HL037PA3]|nr:hypothetical protein HMPREF9621_02234 [Cutibacterium modestum HL037PA2]EFT14567.1 hypothetical protein HMPREF9622_02422 [Cutibacterium modestum HL037PA3]